MGVANGCLRCGFRTLSFQIFSYSTHFLLCSAVHLIHLSIHFLATYCHLTDMTYFHKTTILHFCYMPSFVLTLIAVINLLSIPSFMPDLYFSLLSVFILGKPYAVFMQLHSHIHIVSCCDLFPTHHPYLRHISRGCNKTGGKNKHLKKFVYLVLLGF